MLYCLPYFFIFFSMYLSGMETNTPSSSKHVVLKKNVHENILPISDTVDKSYNNYNKSKEKESNNNIHSESVFSSPDSYFKNDDFKSYDFKNNNLKYDLKHNVSLNDMPELTGKKSSADIGITHSSFFNSSMVAQEASAIAEEIQSQNKIKNGKKIKDIVLHRAIQEGASYGNARLSSFLSHYGNIKLNASLEDDLSLHSLSFDYLFPFYVSKQTIGFAQFGYHEWDKRHLFNTGLGYRAVYEHFMWGINAFLDKDMTLGYRRLSLGVELGKDYLLSYGNYYFPVSAWHSVDSPFGYSLESTPAEGWDLGIKTVFPFCPSLSGSVGFFQWYGHHVDLLGGFNENIGPKKYNDIESNNPCGIDLSLEYKPFSLLSAGVTEKLGINKINDLRLFLNINFSFDQSLSQQLAAQSVSSHMLNSLERSFVKRNQKMVLDYRENPTFQKRITVLLSALQVVDEKQSLTFDPHVISAFPVISYLWEGTGAQFLDRRDVAHPRIYCTLLVRVGYGKKQV